MLCFLADLLSQAAEQDGFLTWINLEPKGTEGPRWETSPFPLLAWPSLICAMGASLMATENVLQAPPVTLSSGG